MIKNIFFDFDGVIAESVNVKAEAFYNIYLPYGKNIADKVREHHLANGGVSRFRKFEYYHKNFLGRDINESQINELALRFSELVLEKVVNAPLVSGISDFLNNNYKTYRLWVITGTPTEEIKIILNRKGLDNYFISAVGSPSTKSHWVNKLLKEHNLDKEECIFIGDALSDYNAAIENGIKFVLRQTEDNTRLFNDKMEISGRINNFDNFENTLRSL